MFLAQLKMKLDVTDGISNDHIVEFVETVSEIEVLLRVAWRNVNRFCTMVTNIFF